MLASPLYPASPFSQQRTEDATQYGPVRDLDAFNILLPPPIEFVEGSSSGAFAIAEGKYDAVNASPKATTKNLPRENGKISTPTTIKNQKAFATPSSTHKRPQLYNGAVELSWPRGCTVGTGLNNTGNTCFLNSALQCLLHTPPLLHVLSSHTKAADPCRVRNGFCMCCNLRQVAEESHTNKHSFVPYPITTKLQTIAKHMRRGRQEDSHEFLRYAIDALQKSCLAGYSSKIDPKIAETTWVHRIFGGRLRSRVTCRECQHNSDTMDSILDLSLDIHGVDGLKDALRKFVAIDYLRGADKYKCEKCKKAVTAEKRFTVHDAPVVLTIHLKRFSPLGRKIGHHVKYDERLTLQSIMSEGQFGPTYLLYGVICHAGGGPNSGHYYAHIKSAAGQWYEMNDDMVSPQRSAPLGLKNAYILFYIRDKGQSLEATVHRPIKIPKAGVIANMKKRKVIESDDEMGGEDIGVKAPFIGPVLPSAMSVDEGKKQLQTPVRDPQADLVQKKIASVSHKPSTALSSLAQYHDDESDSPKEENVEAEVTSDTKTDGFVTESSPPPPPSSPAPSSIPTSSFYSNSSVNEKKRKSPDGDEGYSASFIPSARHSLSTPSPKRASLGHRNDSRKSSSFGGGAFNPYNRLKKSSNLHWSEPRRNYNHKQIQYGGKKRKMLI